MLIEKGIRGGICHAIHRYAKSNNNYIKNYDKNTLISHAFRCKQFVWMDNVSKIVCNWF